MQWKDRWRAASVHLGISGVFALLAAVLVFWVLFPHPYRQISGGLELFGLVVSVDLLLGPLLTFSVFNLKKPRRELFLDISLIALVQVAALCYGLWTVFLARPVYLVHEVDRFQVVTAADIDPADLEKALPEFRILPLHGIRLIGIRKSQNLQEMMGAVESAMAGKDLARMPHRWQNIDANNHQQIRQRGHDVAFLRRHTADSGAALDSLITKSGVKPIDIIGLPLVSRRNDWAVLLNREDLSIIGYLPINLLS